jgi:hypothetical protein
MNAQEPMFELIDVVRVEPRGGYRLAVAFFRRQRGRTRFLRSDR